MKKLKFINSVLIILLFFCFSCSDENVIDQEQDMKSKELSKPALKSFQSSSLWENKMSVVLKSGEEVYTPWANTTVTTNIPLDVRKDIKAKDGWVFVYTNLEATIGRDNLIVFYNRFTGVLKGFYYWGGSGIQNNGIWLIGFEGGSTKLLNGADYFTVPLDSVYPFNEATVFNITRNKNLAFEIGWNCFQTTLTYDPYYNINEVKPYAFTQNSNTGSIKTGGSFSSESDGTIISQIPTSGAQTGKIDALFTPIGKAALNLLKPNGVSNVWDVVDGTLKWIFGSSSGKKSTNANNNYSLQFTSKGKLEITGTLKFNGSGILPTKSGIYTDSEERLGVWNLKKKPTVAIDNCAYLGRPINSDYDDYTDKRWRELYRFIRLEDVDTKDVIVNDFVKTLIDGYDVDARMVYYERFNGSDRWNNVETNRFFKENRDEKLIYSDNDNTFWYLTYNRFCFDCNCTLIDQFYCYPTENDNYLYKDPSKAFVVKVTVTLYPKASLGYDPTPIVTTKTFMPNQVIKPFNYYGW